MRIIISICLLTLVHIAYSQDKKKIEFTSEGQIALVTNGKGFFVNFGGPGIKFKTKAVDIKLNMMPSLRFQKEDPKPFITPLLGVGPQFYFTKSKRFILSFPFYYYPSLYKWEFTGGIGYVITSKKIKNDSEH